MIVLPCRPSVHLLLGRERSAVLFGAKKIIHHFSRRYVVFQAEIHCGVGPCVEQVVALVLRIAHAELFLNVSGKRMPLEREISTTHGVEKIESDGKLRTKSFSDFLARSEEHTSELQSPE